MGRWLFHIAGNKRKDYWRKNTHFNQEGKAEDALWNAAQLDEERAEKIWSAKEELKERNLFLILINFSLIYF